MMMAITSHQAKSVFFYGLVDVIVLQRLSQVVLDSIKYDMNNIS